MCSCSGNPHHVESLQLAVARRPEHDFVVGRGAKTIHVSASNKSVLPTSFSLCIARLENGGASFDTNGE
ncbi:hypothetical protein D3C81_615820 [compost metagenome]